MEQRNLADALLQNNKPWPPAVENKFLDYWERAQSHTDIMTYQNGDGVFEIPTFSRDGKGGNVHTVNAKTKICS
ncbi:MAG: hypothetical protein Q8842_02040, partial [Candidatus Phytoplasma australasiaticum]|nr:hypothetical protein [Candidatus Phytoplasma australasiaticum]